MAKAAEKTELSFQSKVLEPYLDKAVAIVWGNYKGDITPCIFV